MQPQSHLSLQLNIPISCQSLRITLSYEYLLESTIAMQIELLKLLFPDPDLNHN